MAGNQPIVLGYVRVSTAEQRQGWSLGLQEQYIREACEREGWLLGDIFRDEGRSGSRAITRPGLMACLRQLAQGGYGALVITKEDRLARSIADAADLRVEVFRSGANVVLLEPFSIERPEGQDFLETSMRQVAQIIAEDELERMKQRIEPGIAKAARAGRRGGHTPPGYRRVDAATFLVDPYWGLRITEAFRSTAAGHSLYRVHGALMAPPAAPETHDLRALGIDQVRYLLSNRFYLGELNYRLPLSQRAGSDGRIVTPHHHPPLTDAVTFAAVQEVLAGRKRRHAQRLQTGIRTKNVLPAMASPLIDESLVPVARKTAAPRTIHEVVQAAPQRRLGQGLLSPTVARCHSCGSHVYCARQTVGPPGHRSSRYFYTCHQRHRLGPQSCPEKPMRRDDIDANFLHQFLEKTRAGAFAPTEPTVAPHQPQAIAEQTADLALRIQRLEAVAQVGDALFDEQRHQRLAQMRAEFKAASERLSVAAPQGSTKSAVRDRFLADPHPVWLTLTHVERVDLVSACAERVYLGEKSIQKIEWRLAPHAVAGNNTTKVTRS